MAQTPEEQQPTDDRIAEMIHAQLHRQTELILQLLARARELPTIPTTTGATPAGNWRLWTNAPNVRSWQDLAYFAAQPIYDHHAGIRAAHDSLYALLEEVSARARRLPADQVNVEMPISALLDLDDRLWQHAYQCFSVGTLVGWALVRTWPESPETLNEWLERASAYAQLDEHGAVPWGDDES